MYDRNGCFNTDVPHNYVPNSSNIMYNVIVYIYKINNTFFFRNYILKNVQYTDNRQTGS